jgi:hypothetical protein
MQLTIQSIRACAGALLVTLLAACGGGGGGAEVPTTAAQCYRLTNGNEFLTATTRTPDSFALTSTRTVYFEPSVEVGHIAIQAATFNGAPAQSVISTGTRTYPSPNARQAVNDRSETFSTITSDKFNVLGSRDTTAAGVTSDTIFNGNSLSLNLAVGATEILTVSSKLPSSTTTTVISFALKLLSIEDVTTHAGTFKNACKFSIQSVAPSDTASSANTDAVADSTFWIAPGWGSVKEINRASFTYEGFPILRTETTEATYILKGNL